LWPRLQGAVSQPSVHLRAEAACVRGRPRGAAARWRWSRLVDAGARLKRLLAWMSGQDFSDMARGDPSLLGQVEAIVVGAHRRLYESKGQTWSRPVAYRWLRYENPMPVERLLEGVEKLEMAGAQFDGAAVEKACAEGVAKGFSI